MTHENILIKNLNKACEISRAINTHEKKERNAYIEETLNLCRILPLNLK
jgi:hypothetical protein